MRQFAARGIKEGTIHILPEFFDMLRILTDQPPRRLRKRVPRAALAYPRNPGVCFNRNDDVALIEKRVRIRRKIGSHSGNLHLRYGRKCSPPPCRSDGCCRCQVTKKRPSVHDQEVLLPISLLSRVRKPFVKLTAATMIIAAASRPSSRGSS
jgi:hypothetical protein